MAETKRVIYYDQLSGNQPTNGDVIFVDNPTTGTHKMDLKSFVDMINNGFDSSIKSSGVSVSADNYSSIITNVNDQPVNSIYTYGAGLQSHVSNLPSNKAMTIVNFAQKSTGGLGQVMLAVERNGSGDYLYFRTIGGSPAAWSSWVKVANSADVEAVREALDNLDIETDKTLSVDGKPADAKAAGDAINDLKADLSELIAIGSVNASASGNYYVPFEILNGNIYKITTTSTASISIATVDSGNQTIQSISSTSPGTDVVSTFTATADAPKVLFYFRASGNARIEDISLRVPILENDVANIKNEISELQNSEDNFNSYNNEINRGYIKAPSRGNYYIDYPVTAGNIYKIITTCLANSVTVATTDANNTTIETIGTLITGTHSITFVPTTNAAKIMFYFRAEGHGSIIELSKNGNQWLGNRWSCYGDSISWNYGWQPIVNSLLGFNGFIRNGKPGARIAWVDNTFGINEDGIYTTDNPVDTVHESMCAYDRISKTINNDLPLIFVMGGTNDYLSNTVIGDLAFNVDSTVDSAWNTEHSGGDYDISTLKGAMASMFMKLQYHAPNALIVFGTLCNGIGNTAGVNQYSESTNTGQLKPSDYAKAEKEVCEIFGIPYIDVFGECGINITNRATYISDTVHPNTEGNKLLARCVASGLLKTLPR